MIGFQGLPGAYSDLAIRRYFPNPQSQGFRSFSDVHKALQEGVISDAFLPFENSVAGIIEENFQLMLHAQAHVCGEYLLRVEHCLLAHPESPESGIVEVASHPQALAQCRDFLIQRGWKARDFFDTAAAAQDIGTRAPKERGAIASEGAAELYGLKILHRDIADQPGNQTRFLHLRKGAFDPESFALDERFLVIMTEKQAGSLLDACQEAKALGFAGRILAQIPTRAEAWTYHGFVELTLPGQSAQLPQKLRDLALKIQGLKVLGTYKPRG